MHSTHPDHLSLGAELPAVGVEQRDRMLPTTPGITRCADREVVADSDLARSPRWREFVAKVRQFTGRAHGAPCAGAHASWVHWYMDFRGASERRIVIASSVRGYRAASHWPVLPPLTEEVCPLLLQKKDEDLQSELDSTQDLLDETKDELLQIEC